MRELLSPSCLSPDDFNGRQFIRFQGMPENTWGKDDAGRELLSWKSPATP
jgi:hypothetical protein